MKSGRDRVSVKQMYSSRNCLKLDVEWLLRDYRGSFIKTLLLLDVRTVNRYILSLRLLWS
jgi:hypothetical protein